MPEGKGQKAKDEKNARSLLPSGRGFRRGRQGFTLVEVLVATVILAIGLIGALTAFSIASRVTGVSTDDTALTFLAQEKLSEIQTLGREGLATAETRGDFAPARPEYKWELVMGKPDERNVVRVDLAIRFPEAGRTREVWFSTNIF